MSKRLSSEAPSNALPTQSIYALVAKFTGANDQGKLSWVSGAYKPIYKIRSLRKEKIKPRSLVAYNVIKWAASHCFSIYYICYCDLSSLGVHLRRQRLELR